jgi:hypothetical protein
LKKIVPILSLWLFAVFLSARLPAEDKTSYRLDLKRLPPKTGDEFEGSIQIVSANTLSNRFQDQITGTNRNKCRFLKCREKILAWDTTNKTATIDFTVERLFNSQNDRTNELIKPGMHVLATMIAGESFFKPVDGHLTEDAIGLLKIVNDFDPGCSDDGSSLNESLNITKPRTVGERWELSQSSPLDKTDRRSRLADVLFGNSTNGVTRSVRYAGNTNLFGVDCFHLEFVTTISPHDLQDGLDRNKAPTEKTSNRFEGTITLHLIEPFDKSKQVGRTEASLDISRTLDGTINGTNIILQKIQSNRIITEHRPVN